MLQNYEPVEHSQSPRHIALLVLAHLFARSVEPLLVEAYLVVDSSSSAHRAACRDVHGHCSRPHSGSETCRAACFHRLSR